MKHKWTKEQEHLIIINRGLSVSQMKKNVFSNVPTITEKNLVDKMARVYGLVDYPITALPWTINELTDMVVFVLNKQTTKNIQFFIRRHNKQLDQVKWDIKHLGILRTLNKYVKNWNSGNNLIQLKFAILRNEKFKTLIDFDKLMNIIEITLDEPVITKAKASTEYFICRTITSVKENELEIQKLTTELKSKNKTENERKVLATKIALLEIDNAKLIARQEIENQKTTINKPVNIKKDELTKPVIVVNPDTFVKKINELEDLIAEQIFSNNKEAEKIQQALIRSFEKQYLMINNLRRSLKNKI